MIQAVGIGAMVAYGVFFNSLIDEFHWSRAVVSGASSCAFLLSGVFAIFVGRLSDIYGPKILMSFASIFFGAGLMLMSKVSEIWHLYLFYGVIFGIGLSAIDVIALTTTARWFSQTRGMMTGIVKVGTGAGQFAAPFLASVLIAFYGWRQAYIIIGLAALVLLLWIAQILQSRPEDQDVPILTGSKSGRVQVNPVILRSLNAAQALGTLQLWLLCTANVLLVFCLLIIIVHIVPHAIDTGLSSRQAAGVLSTIGAVSMVGRFASGWSIDRIGSKAVMLNCFAILISVLFWLQIADCPWKLYLFASVYGLAHGGFFTAISPIVAEIFGIASHGAIFGMIVFSGTVGGSVGPVVAGKIFDSMGSYALTFQMITVLSVISLGLIILVKPIEH